MQLQHPSFPLSMGALWLSANWRFAACLSGRKSCRTFALAMMKLTDVISRLQGASDLHAIRKATESY